jgi:hypothetical protein
MGVGHRGAGLRLPDFLVLGVPKAGTTTLARWLADHPGCFVPPEKELDFFNLEWHTGLDAYAARFTGAPTNVLIGEATPGYLLDPGWIGRIAVTLPDARFVVILREPIARAFSNHGFFQQSGVDPRPWEKVIAEELERPLVGPAGMTPGYFANGRYADQLEDLHRLVDPAAVHVCFFDDLVADGPALFRGVCEHLGLDPSVVPEPQQANPTVTLRSPRVQWLLRLARRVGLPVAIASRVGRWNVVLDRAPRRLEPAEVRALRAQFGLDEQIARLPAILGRPLPERWTA